VRVAAVYDGAEASRAFGNGEVPVVNVAAVAVAAAATITTGRRCQGVRVDVRQRQRRAGSSGSGRRSGGRAAAEAAGGQAGGDSGSVTSGLGCGDGAPCLAWGPGCELGDMPPVLVDGAVDCPVEVPAWFMGLCGFLGDLPQSQRPAASNRANPRLRATPGT